MTADSFFNDFIQLAGGENIAADAPSGLYSQEMVLEQNPDVIIITAMGIAGEKEKRRWANFQSINAVKTRRIFIVDADKFCSPTPVSFAEALEQMSSLLHSENNE